MACTAGAITLSSASYEQLAACITIRLAQEREKAEQRLKEVKAREGALQQKRSTLEEASRKISQHVQRVSDIIELNVGGELVTTTRAVLCSADGSLLAGMFSGSFEDSHQRDKDGRVFMEVDPLVFKRILTHLRLRFLCSDDCPAPLPKVPEEWRAEYDMIIKYLGLETFIYGDVGDQTNIMQKIAEMAEVDQGKLQSKGLVEIVLSSTGGVPSQYHEEVFGADGLRDRSLENRWGANPATITIKFLSHKVRVEGMELRSRKDSASHMSSSWQFWHGTDYLGMSFPFATEGCDTGKMGVFGTVAGLVDEIRWVFLKDFCLEHIALYGRVIDK